MSSSMPLSRCSSQACSPGPLCPACAPRRGDPRRSSSARPLWSASGTAGLWSKPTISRPDTSGFAIVEAVVALSLLSLFGGAAIAFSAGGMRAIERAHAASASASTLLKLDDFMRKQVGRVRIPYWERRARVLSDANGATIAYYEGEAAAHLALSCRKGTLTVSAAGETRTFSPIEDFRVAPLAAVAGEPRGIELFFTLSGKRCAIAARFGGSAISRATEGG
jgi:hypothetical protein